MRLAIDCQDHIPVFLETQQSIAKVRPYNSRVVKPTIQDVARAAGVHPGTASRALNTQLAGRVTPETTRRVEEAAARLGYVPDQMARNLRTRRSYTVGVLIPDLGNPVFPPIVRGIEDTLRDAGYEALVANTDDSAERQRNVIGVLQARRCDGFVIGSARADDPDVVNLLRSDTPTVLVNRLVNGASLSISSDDDQGMQAAVDHLAALGHTRIAHVSGPANLSMSSVRLKAFESAMRSNGLDVDPNLVATAERYAADEGQRAFTALLELARPTAVIAGNDMIALGCYTALRARGLQCPTDMSVVGYNDMPLLDFFSPPLTSVSIPQYEIGTGAAELMLRRIEGDRTSEHRTLATELVVRGSTGPPPA